MPEDRDRKNLVSAPPIQTAVVGPNGVMNRAWSVWFRDLYKRVAYKGGNAIDANSEAILNLLEQIEANAKAIKANAEGIESNAEGIEANASNILEISNLIASHIDASEAHGSNGKIVGFNDIAEETKAGLVSRMAAIDDAIDTEVSIVTADIGPAPAAYDQAYAQSIADLVNENKAAINQLAQDFSNSAEVLNNLLAESKLSGQMTTPPPPENEETESA